MTDFPRNEDGSVRAPRTSQIIQNHTQAVVIAHRVAAQIINQEVNALIEAFQAFEFDDGPAPDKIANAVATLLRDDAAGFVTDGTFQVVHKDAGPQPVEYPLTYAGLENASLEVAGLNETDLAAGGDGRAWSLTFKDGPEGPFASRLRETKARVALLNAADSLGAVISSAIN